MLATESALLLQNLVSLSERVSQLGTRLSQAASAVQSTGVLPPKTLIDEITASRHSFSELSAKGIALAEALAVSPPPRPDTIVSLADLKLLLQTLTQAEEKRKASQELSQRALATLDRLYAIKHRDREVFPPLAECQMRGTVLRNAIAETPWPKTHPSVEALGRDDNPFVALLALVEHGETLEDEQCMRLQEIVERAFGKSLAIAALRQKLILLSNFELARESRIVGAVAPEVMTDNSGTATSKRPSTESSRVNGTVAAGIKVEAEKQPAMSSDARPGSTNLKAESPRAGDVLRSVSEPTGEGKATPGDLQNGVKGTKGELPAASDVKPLPVTSEGGERYGETSAQVATAQMRSTSLSESPVNASVPTEGSIATPSAVTNEKRNPKVAKGIGAAYVSYRFEAEDKAKKIANMLLTGAYGVVEEKPVFLRDLIWRLIFEEKLGLAFHVARCLDTQYPDFYPRLPSWLLRTIILAQRVRNPQGEIARLLKDDLARYEADCRTTGDKEWDLAVEFLLLAGSFLPALLAPETRASTVLHGVSLGSGLENLSAYCSVLALYGDQLIPLDPTVLKRSGRMQGKEKESVGFMRRLIGNQEVGGRKDVVSEQAEPLRIEISNRQQTVVDELNLFKTVQSSIALLGGLACCRRAVENVAVLFDPEASFSVDEPLPRPLLNADLSRIPTLTLNKQGDAEGVDQPAFLESILRLVTSGSLKML